jgi:hypothetical protein
VQNDASGRIGWGVCCGHGNAAALSGGLAAAGAKMLGAVVQGQQVTLQTVLSPTVTDENIALLRRFSRELAGDNRGQRELSPRRPLRTLFGLKRHTSIDGRSTPRLRFNHNRATHQPDTLAHADQTQSTHVHRRFSIKANPSI